MTTSDHIIGVVVFILIDGYQQSLCCEFLPYAVTETSNIFITFHANNSNPSTYIEEGYNMIRTDAPNDLGGRLRLNCALTMPELPVTVLVSINSPRQYHCSVTYHVAL